jgi:hypothetical protein
MILKLVHNVLPRCPICALEETARAPSLHPAWTPVGVRVARHRALKAAQNAASGGIPTCQPTAEDPPGASLRFKLLCMKLPNQPRFDIGLRGRDVNQGPCPVAKAAVRSCCSAISTVTRLRAGWRSQAASQAASGGRGDALRMWGRQDPTRSCRFVFVAPVISLKDRRTVLRDCRSASGRDAQDFMIL